VDLFEVTDGEMRRAAFLSVTFGIIADTDVTSEKLRCLGPARFTVCGLWNVLRNRGYRAKVSFQRDERSPEEVVDGVFSSISVFNVSHASASFIAAAERAPADGLLSLVCVGTPGRYSLLKTMIAAETGSQAKKCKWWKPEAIKSFKIELDKRGSIGAGIVVDGEQWPERTISGRILTERFITFQPY
jgi:sphingosine kinase